MIILIIKIILDIITIYCIWELIEYSFKRVIKSSLKKNLKTSVLKNTKLKKRKLFISKF